MKVKVVTIADMIGALQSMLASGARKPDDPFKINGNQTFEFIKDGRSDLIVVEGSGERELDPPEMFRPSWDD